MNIQPNNSTLSENHANSHLPGETEIYRKIHRMLSACNICTKLEESYAQQRQGKVFEIVMGNTGCDEDSFVGSHVLALIEGRVPVVNMSRRIFEHKLDLCYIAKAMGLELNDLVFIETEEDEKVFKKGNERVGTKSTKISAWLVDFSNLDSELLSTGMFQIDRIIDHRKVLCQKELFSHSVCMWIELNAGSCCSLIFHYINMHYSNRISAEPEKYMFILLLCIPILTDTTLLTERVHDLDRSAISEIVSFAKLPEEDIKLFHSAVKKLLCCEDKAETGIILQMCHKKLEYPDGSGRSFGMSTVKYSYDRWIERDTKEVFLSEIQKFIEDKHYEFIIINSNPPGIREFFIYTPPGSDFVQEVLYKDEPIQKREIKNDPELTVYQKDTFFVTKMIIPDILAYLKNRSHKQEQK